MSYIFKYIILNYMPAGSEEKCIKTVRTTTQVFIK